jgi:NADPH2:quinone reductase
VTKSAAIEVQRFGGPEVLESVEIVLPSLAHGQVAIAVEMASVTFVETQMRAGRAPRPEMLPRLPWVPGNGVAGIVTELGEGIDRTLLGARVVSTTGGAGGYAARAVVDGSAPLLVPDRLGSDDAAALVADGRTAIRLTDAAAIRPGERVLVEAAAGGVGSLLVQLAVRAGASVIAAASSGRKLTMAGDLGAAELIDYSRPGWAAEIEPVDVVFDGVGGEIGAAGGELVAAGGRYVPFGAAGGAFGPVDPDLAGERDVAIVASGPPTDAENRRLAQRALAAAADGALKAVIGQRLPLAEAAAAHRAIEARETVGKTLLVP